MQKIKLLFYTIIISLSGALPLGNLNITALQLSIQQGTLLALYFAVAVVIVEACYAFACAQFSHWINKQHKLQKSMHYVMIIVFTCFASYYIYMAFQHGKPQAALNTVVLKNPILLGLSMSAVNPLQIPFWLGWGLYLQQKQLLSHNIVSSFLFALGAALGTLVSLSIFIFIGQKFAAVLSEYMSIIYIALAIMFLVGIYGSIKRLQKPDT